MNDRFDQFKALQPHMKFHIYSKSALERGMQVLDNNVLRTVCGRKSTQGTASSPERHIVSYMDGHIDVHEVRGPNLGLVVVVEAA